MPYDQRLKDQVTGRKKKYRDAIKAGKPVWFARFFCRGRYLYKRLISIRFLT
jgi:hypothetical protein